MQPAHAVALLGGVEGKDAHRELVGCARVLAPHVHQLVPSDAQPGGKFVDVLVEEPFIEVVVPGGNWGVDGVERRSAHHLQCLVEGQLLVLHIVNQSLQVEQRGMTLVAVIDVVLESQPLEQQHTADAQQVLLLDAVLPVAAIELVCDGPVILAVEVQVGVEQIELHSSDIDAPHVGIDYMSGIRHLQNHLLALCVQHRRDGQLHKVLRLVVGNLLPVHRECLGEVAIAIEESDGSHVDAAVAGFLDVVTGQDTQAT